MCLIVRGAACVFHDSWSYTAVALSVAACACAPGPPTTTTAPSTPSVRVTPANIERVRGELPDGYEVADVSGRASPVAFWGFGPDWLADPPQCGALAEPVADAGDDARLVRFGSWRHRLRRRHRLATGAGRVRSRTDRRVRPLDACRRAHHRCRHAASTRPRSTRPQRVGMVTEAKTVVEGGTETNSRAHTVTAYLGDYLAFVTVVTDPGSPNPPLGQDFAAALLVKTVSALRG